MKRYRLTRRAQRELDEIIGYRADRHQRAGERLAVEFAATFTLLDQFPGMGRERSDLTPQPVLFFPIDRFHIVYRQETSPTEIVAILHGALDISQVL